MKRLFTIFFALLLGITAAFAQTQPTLPYQAVVRDNQNHLLKDADVSIDVQIYEGATLRYSETQTPHSNANGLISFNIGAGSGATGTMADVADWRVAKFKFTYHLTDGDVVVTDSVHAVPYALQTAFATGGNFLTSDSAVITTMQGNITTNTTDIAANTADIAALANRVNTFNTNVCDSVATCVGNAIDARGFLTSDSAVITTMQGNIATNTTDIATNTADIAALANRVNTFNTNVCDSVKDCDFSGNASIQNMLQELSDLISAQNHKIDSLGHIVDSLSNLTPGGGDEPTTTFTCGTSKVKDVENNEYNTVLIGEQCWMAENMRAIHGRDSSSISLGISTSYDTPYRYNPNGNSAIVSKYGYLYNWEAAKKVCPNGWHLPTEAECQTLMDYCSDHYAAGGDRYNNAKALAATDGWEYPNDSPFEYAVGKNQSANNQSGFSALPAGSYNSDYINFGRGAYFWSSTPNGESNAYNFYMSYSYSNAGLLSNNRYTGRSVRCLRDAGVGGGDTPGGDEPTIVDTVTCYPNLGSNVPEKKTVTRGENLDLSTTFTHPAETNWEIAGWNTSADGTGTSYTNTITTSGNLTLYAQWHTFCTGTPNTSVNEFGSNRIDSLQDADNNKYTVVQIGNQCWMAVNLRTTHYADNTPITLGTTSNKSTEVGYYYDYSSDDPSIPLEQRGYLYNWPAAMKSTSNPEGTQGICPTGWHLPTKAEWQTMVANADASTLTGAVYLSASCYWNGSNPATDGMTPNSYDNPDRNKSGFSAVPAGFFDSSSFVYSGNNANFWSSSLDGSYAWCRYLDSGNTSVRENKLFKNYGFSVRCVRD